MAKYKDLIDRGRKQFAQELDSIMPDVKLGNRGKTLKCPPLMLQIHCVFTFGDRNVVIYLLW